MPGGPLGHRRLTIGSLRNRVAVQAAAANPARDAGGQEVRAYETAADNVPARVEAVTGRELMKSDAPQAAATHRVYLRHRADLTPKHRLLWRDNRDLVLNVTAVLESVGGSNLLELLCTVEQ